MATKEGGYSIVTPTGEQAPAQEKWIITHPPGATFQATNTGDTHLVFAKGREVEVYQWLERELERIAWNTFRREGAPVQFKAEAPTKPEPQQVNIDYVSVYPHQVKSESDPTSVPAAVQEDSSDVLPGLPKESSAPTAKVAGFKGLDPKQEPVIIFCGVTRIRTVALIVDTSIAHLPAAGARQVAAWLNGAAEKAEAAGGSPPELMGSCYTVKDDGSYSRMVANHLGISIEG